MYLIHKYYSSLLSGHSTDQEFMTSATVIQTIAVSSWYLSLASVTIAGLAGQPLMTANGESSQGKTWAEKYGKQIDQPFSGPLAFSHLPYSRCLDDDSAAFDVAILGLPFDTGVSYRPGARFGPYAIRSGSRRQGEHRGYTMSWGNDPYTAGYKILDCGDVCIVMRLDQMSSEKNSYFLGTSKPFR
jgi:agmatinase